MNDINKQFLTCTTIAEELLEELMILGSLFRETDVELDEDIMSIDDELFGRYLVSLADLLTHVESADTHLDLIMGEASSELIH